MPGDVPEVAAGYWWEAANTTGFGTTVVEGVVVKITDTTHVHVNLQLAASRRRWRRSAGCSSGCGTPGIRIRPL